MDRATVNKKARRPQVQRTSRACHNPIARTEARSTKISYSFMAATPLTIAVPEEDGVVGRDQDRDGDQRHQRPLFAVGPGVGERHDLQDPELKDPEEGLVGVEPGVEE